MLTLRVRKLRLELSLRETLMLQLHQFLLLIEFSSSMINFRGMMNFIQKSYNWGNNLFQKAKHNLVGVANRKTVYNIGWIEINSTTNVQSPLQVKEQK